MKGCKGCRYFDEKNLYCNYREDWPFRIIYEERGCKEKKEVTYVQNVQP